jgi:hypothetical protein
MAYETFDDFPDHGVSGELKTHFRFSGRVNVGRWIAMLAVGVDAAILLGAVYAAGVYYVPFIYLNGLFTLALGAALGWCGWLVCRYGKCRNQGLAIISWILLYAVAMYTAWAFWLFFNFHDDSGISLVECFDPMLIFNLIHGAVVLHFFEITVGKEGGMAISGWGLAVLWGIEAAVVFFLGMFVMLGQFRDSAFCESCSEWAKPHWISTPLLPTEDIPTAEPDETFESADLAELGATLRPIPAFLDSDGSYMIAQLVSCPCGRTDLFSLQKVTVATNPKKKNERTEKKAYQIRHLVISKADAERIRMVFDCATH